MSVRAQAARTLQTFRRTSRVLGKRFAIRMYLANLLWPDGHAYDEPVDERWDIDTSGDYDFDDDDLPDGLANDADGYEGARTDTVRHAIGLVPVDRATTEFWDLGSGKGKIAFVAATEGFRRIVGVELNEQLHATAVTNLERVRPHLPDAEIDLRHESATEVNLPDGPLVVFMFNPFRRTVFSNVLERLEARARRSAEPLWIVYLHPLEHELMLGSAEFELVHEETVNPFWWSSYIYRSTAGA